MLRDTSYYCILLTVSVVFFYFRKFNQCSKFKRNLCRIVVKISELICATSKLTLDVYGSVHHNINRLEITNKMRPLLFQCFLIAQHISSDIPLIIRSSKILIAASGFTYVCGCRQPQTYVKPEAAITVLSSW
jgi:hypothetical protein